MLWLVILLVAAAVAYRFAAGGAQSGTQGHPVPNALGSIWSGSGSMGIPVARFGSGQIWAGSGGAGAPIGGYRDGHIWQGSGTGGIPVGRYADGKIWEGSGAGAPIGGYGDGMIWAGSGGSGITLARYDGESDGAAAAALILKLVKRPEGFGMPIG
jgi:hypothetical protein